MRPNSVSAPVAKTTPRPVPDATLVPAKTRLRAWIRGTFSSTALRLPPHRIRLPRQGRVARRQTRTPPAAGSRQRPRRPRRTGRRRPGTSSSAATSAGAPSRSTRARAGSSRISASAVRSARYSCTKPITAFSSTTAKTATATFRFVGSPWIRYATSVIVAGDLEQDREEVTELRQEPVERRAAAQLRQAVRPVLREPLPRLLRAQT